MGKNVNVYLDDPSAECLEQRREKDPNFNLSSFIQAKLQESETKLQDPDAIKLEIERKDAQVNLLKKEMDLMKEQERIIRIKREQEQKEQIENILKEQKRKEEKINVIADNFISYFENISIPQSLDLAREFESIPKEERGTIFEFGQLKGLKSKE